MTKEIALTAAKREAEIKDLTERENGTRGPKKPETEEQRLEPVYRRLSRISPMQEKDGTELRLQLVQKGQIKETANFSERGIKVLKELGSTEFAVEAVTLYGRLRKLTDMSRNRLPFNSCCCANHAADCTNAIANIASDGCLRLYASFLKGEPCRASEKFDAKIAVWIFDTVVALDFLSDLPHHVVEFLKSCDDMAERKPMIVGLAISERDGENCGVVPLSHETLSVIH